MSYLKAICGKITTHVNSREGKLTLGMTCIWKWATMATKIRPVQVTRGDADADADAARDLRVDFF